MTVHVGSHAFGDVEYDVDADIVYLRTGQSEPVIGDETGEGHVLCYSEAHPERLVGIDLFNARSILSREGTVIVTLPDQGAVPADGLEEGIGAPRGAGR